MSSDLDPISMEAFEAVQAGDIKPTHTVVHKYSVPSTSHQSPSEVPAGPNSKVVLVAVQPSGVKIWVQQECQKNGTLVTDRTWLVRATETGKILVPEWEHIGSQAVMTMTSEGAKSVVFHLFKIDKLAD